MEFQSLTCPICFKEYSEVRKPMIVCVEGHSVCECCLKNIYSCPFCRTSLKNFQTILNVDLLQLVEKNKNKQIIPNVPIIPLSQINIGDEPFAGGGSADIYRVQWGTNQVALKKLRIQADEKSKKEFQNELQLATKLSHSNIIRIFGIVEFDKSFGILMEYAEQGNLEQKIPNLTFQEQIDYSLKIIDGIKYLHLKSIIHRDLKPQNILISNNQPKISNFGLSKISEHTMKVTSVALSLLYSAPELFQQGNEYDSSCDIFSLSMILFQIFSKKQPFQNENSMIVTMKIMQGTRPEFPNNFPKELIEVIKKGWSQNRKERCSLNEFIQCLDQMKRTLQTVNSQINNNHNNNPIIQIFVKTWEGKRIDLEVNKEDSVDSLMEKIHESEGTPVEQFRSMYKGKQLQSGKRLNDYNIQCGTTIQLILKLRGGGSCLPDMQFANMTENAWKTRDWSKDAPDWRKACNGLNLEGKCTNKDCKAHNEWVIMHFGFGTFEMNSQKVLEKSICPICKELVESEKPAFVDCKWKFEGIKKENGKLKKESSEWQPIGNHYHVFDLEKGGTATWKSLTFYTEKND